MANTSAREAEAKDAELVRLFFHGRKLDASQMQNEWKVRGPACLGQACYAAWLQVGRMLYAENMGEYDLIVQGAERRRQDREVLARERVARTNVAYAC